MPTVPMRQTGRERFKGNASRHDPGENSAVKTTREPRGVRRVVVLTREDETTALLVHALTPRCDEVITIVEEPESRLATARRRARRIGRVRVAGQLVFAALVVPLLRRRARARVTSILASADSEAAPVTVRRVESVNAPATLELLRLLDPAVVVVLGTRIIASTVLEGVGCPFVNLHAGITPRYRGMHGAYWALSERRADLVGTTVHLVDRGIDTGQVLGRAYFRVEPEDSIVTYPYLNLVEGLPVLADQVARLLDGGPPCAGTSPVVTGAAADPAAELTAGDSRLWSHPTLWGYLGRRLISGLR